MSVWCASEAAPSSAADPFSRVLAQAFECLRQTAPGAAVRDELFAIGADYAALRSMGPLDWRVVAERVGAQDPGRVARCVRMGQADEALATQTYLASLIDVEGTPTIVANGIQFTGYPGPAPLLAALKELGGK